MSKSKVETREIVQVEENPVEMFLRALDQLAAQGAIYFKSATADSLTIEHSIVPENRIEGAEIEAAVVKAIEVMEDQGLIAQKALIYAVNAISPSTADIEYMTLLAIKECNDRDLLPPKYREMLGDRKSLDQKLSETRPQESRGRREL